MDADRWNLLSTWHNAWLAADSDERERLRAQIAAEEPDLALEADQLAAASADLDGFLETPALVLAIPELAQEIPTLCADTMVGPYRIVGLLAHGGMGDVYRATDVRLRRDVALKVMPHTNPGDPQRVERFLLEARVTASLDHANVVKLFDVGVHDGLPFLVTELLDGETLSARIERGPLPPDTARRIAAEVARGLVAAHAAGLVHRDLKPQNIFLTRSGVAKILDFGIAKLAPGTAARDGLATATGALLGTAGYLAPEQIQGDVVDHRADLFALGSMLFEMLTGQRAFAREHTIDTLYAILHEAPPGILEQKTDVPPPLVAIVARLLEKPPDVRFQSAADLAWALEQVAGTGMHVSRGRVSPRNPTTGWHSRRLRWSVATGLAVLASVGWWVRREAATEPALPAPTRFSWSLSDGTELDSAPAVSPDGRSIVFSGLDGSGSRLYVRSLSTLEATPIAGTDGAKQPFWSPDAQSVGFFAGGKLVKVALAGGAPVVICDAPDARGGTWSRSGTIVFAPDLIESALERVSANGGPVEPATELDESQGENAHRWPVFLPDGIHFLYFVRSSLAARRGVYIARVDRPAARPGSPLFQSESEAVYAPLSGSDQGVVLSVTRGGIEARWFDAARLAVVGDARTIAVPAGGNTLYHGAMLSASADLLATVSSSIPFGSRLGSVERNGNSLRIANEYEAQDWPRLSPDGRRLARLRIDPRQGNPDIWVEDLDRGTRLRITTSPHRDMLPVWSPDGNQLAYVTGTKNQWHLSIAAADGTGVAAEVPCPRPYCEPTDWSPDGQQLIVNTHADSGAEIWAVAVVPGGASHPLLSESFNQRDARLSPDGRWVAYVSEESGRPEVSVRTLVGPPRRSVISSGGGEQPVWRRDGAELLFVDPRGRLRGVPVRATANGTLTFGGPVELNVPAIGAGHWGTQYDVSPDGRRVYFLDRRAERPPHEIHFVLGWRALLR